MRKGDNNRYWDGRYGAAGRDILALHVGFVAVKKIEFWVKN